MTALAIPIVGPSLAEALRDLRDASELADLVELRLDKIGHPGEAALREFVASCPKPVIVTVHGPEAFGTFGGSIDERCELLLTADQWQGAAEAAVAGSAGARDGRRLHCSRVVRRFVTLGCRT